MQISTSRMGDVKMVKVSSVVENDKNKGPRTQDELPLNSVGEVSPQNETLFSILEGIEEIIYISDPESHECLFVNKKGKEIFGEIMAGEKCHKYFQGLDSPCAVCSKDKIFGENEGLSFVREWRNRKNNRWYRCITKGIRWFDGRPVRFELAIDVNEPHAMGEALALRLQYEKMVADISAQALMIDDLEEYIQNALEIMGRALDVSRIYIFEHDPETDTLDNTFEWVAEGVTPQREVLRGIPADSIPWWMGMMAKGGAINFYDIEDIPGQKEKEILRPQGIKSILVVPIIFKSVLHGFIGFDECRFHREWKEEDVRILRAISEIITGKIRHDRVKESLAESETKYRQLFEMESDALFLIENDTGRVLEVNPAASEMYGYGREDFLQMDNTQVSAEPEETRKVRSEHLTTVPIRYHKKSDGTVFPVEISARHFTWKGRDVHLATIRDISRRITAEEEKRKLDQRLQQSQKMEAIGTLAGGIAHDFNNILSGIMGFTDIAILNLPEDSSSRQYMDEVLNTAERAKKLVGQILEFSRGAATDLRPLRMSAVLKESLKFFESMLPATIEIQEHLDAKDDVVMADPTQIHQVLMNLFTNATHALSDKPGRLTVDLSEVALSVDDPLPHPALRHGPHILLSVIDSGCGMAPEILPRIFDPYFTTKEKGKGTGLGLSVVDGIIRKHGGGIVVESEPGKGSSFHIYLPRLQHEPVQSAEKELEILPTGGERILLVDDEAALVDITGRNLKNLGYDVKVRTSSVEALELFRNQPDRFDLIITDQSMPNMTGSDLALEITSIRPDIPIILCTGFSEFATDSQAQEFGIRRILKKPMVRHELARVVRAVLDGER
ncbi:MAG: ATP-binding protein [Desulfatiglandales bacterium]